MQQTPPGGMLLMQASIAYEVSLSMAASKGALLSKSFR